MSSLPDDEREMLLSETPDDELDRLEFDWTFWGRPAQFAPPDPWDVWLVMAGRGFGKTRTGAEWIRWRVQHGISRRVALVAPTAADARDIMVEGESGILATAPPWFRPKYEPSKRRLTWPNGAIATVFSADEPDRLRGPQHDAGWCDEIRSWRYPEAWDNLMFGLRLGNSPQVCATTTPVPNKLVRDLIKAPGTVITRGTTYENVGNLAPAFLDRIVRRYEGTRMGRQELRGELLEDVPGALWKRAMFEERRDAPDLVRVVVGVDPSVSKSDSADETGIIVAGKGADGHGYTLADYSLQASPDEWAQKVVTAYRAFNADRIVAEANNGGEMVRLTIRTVDPSVPVTLVHASRGKHIRAEPVSALYEQGRWHHVTLFADLEDQLCTWTPEEGDSPDRLDALVWAATALMPEIAGGGLIGAVA